MTNTNNNNKKSIGFKGEKAVIDKLKTAGFELYKRNIKSLDSEIDAVVYKYNAKNYTLDIRVIEVKTRSNYEFNLINFDIAKKWRLIRKHLFSIKSEIDSTFDVLNHSKVHFDLALVRHKDGVFDLYSYIKDVNLML